MCAYSVYCLHNYNHLMGYADLTPQNALSCVKNISSQYLKLKTSIYRSWHCRVYIYTHHDKPDNTPRWKYQADQQMNQCVLVTLLSGRAKGKLAFYYPREKIRQMYVCIWISLYSKHSSCEFKEQICITKCQLNNLMYFKRFCQTQIIWSLSAIFVIVSPNTLSFVAKTWEMLLRCH